MNYIVFIMNMNILDCIIYSSKFIKRDHSFRLSENYKFLVLSSFEFVSIIENQIEQDQ